MSYEAAEKVLSSRMVSKSAIVRLPVMALSRWCATHGIVVNSTGKKAGSAIKCDYVEAIWKFVSHISLA